MSTRQWSDFEASSITRRLAARSRICQSMEKRWAIAAKPVCNADNSTARSAAVNTTRMKNLPVSTSSNCWASRMFCPFWARKVDTAETMPGRSGQDRVRTNWLWGILIKT
jgi:hypothetical protein